MLVVHANWTEGSLHVWGESLSAFLARAAAPQLTPALVAPAGGDGGEAPVGGAGVSARHDFAATPDALRGALADLDAPEAHAALAAGREDVLMLRLPRDAAGPRPSDRIAAAAGAVDPTSEAWLEPADVPCIALDPADTLAALISLESADPPDTVEYGQDLRYWMAVGRFALELLAGQRFIPTMVRRPHHGLQAMWQPWLHDEATRARVGKLLTAMPASARAVVNGADGQPWPILDDALGALVDGTVRRALTVENYAEAIEGREPDQDPHVAWLAGLLATSAAVPLTDGHATDILRDVGRWVRRLDETSRDLPMRLCLRLNEPENSELLPDLVPLDDSVRWRLSLHLRAVDDPRRVIDAEQIWGLAGAAAMPAGRQEGRLDELLLTELGRASRIYPRLESALAGPTPVDLEVTTAEAYEFLSEFVAVLEESGFIVETPPWWDDPVSRLGTRLQIESDELDDGRLRGGSVRSTAPSCLGLNALVRYRWQIAVGDQTLTQQEFDRLAIQTAPLIRVRGRWVQLQPAQVKAAIRFLRERPGGDIRLLEAIQLAHGIDRHRLGLPVLGMDATGWVGDLVEATTDAGRMPPIEQPAALRGELRPYQRAGLSWMAFLDRLGFGACLADDMGLGKTVQLIALLQHERAGAAGGEPVGPTLLLVPTSLIGNWTRELERFAPELTCHVHHGPERPTGDAFLAEAARRDVVITTYGLVSRDLDTLGRATWHRVALDEAQYIKNPPTKQTSAIRSLKTERRVALTGTPVENRLTELWSIMEFCNPGYLGPPGEFRRRFAVPIERHRDPQRAAMLRELVRPFVLRRLKTDPTVIDDLPACVQTKEYANLTPEQAAVYQQIVDGMLNQVDRAEGIQRRGLVLAALVRLKQVCDHPVLVHDAERGERSKMPRDASSLVHRSGKARRLVTMLEEVRATDERALIFTQFRQMGHLLAAMIQHELDCEVQFMHGGTPPARRQQMVDRFQDPAGDTFAFICSLKAGGVGLNLTAATHVFHFDRWWNPAVENQATDRAFRIGQTRRVHVHKFVCTGTLEERIDQMIEEKTELARNIIGSGENWLSELSSTQLREVLTLREDAMELD